MNLLKKTALLIANGFMLGNAPIASGTFGTLPGVLIVILLFPSLSTAGQLLAAAALALLAIPICDVAENHYTKKDDGRIVADEFMTFPLCMIGLPVHMDMWWVLAFAFLSARALDIIKPFPARRLQRIPGGLGVVIDDVISTLYALGVNHLFFYLITRNV